MAAASSSMMKEYLRKQLRYWVDGFNDGMLPRDFGSKSFSRQHLSLAKLHLKSDKIAALLRLPSALVVTRAFCTELSIRVPSWSAPDKFLQEPLMLQLGDLFLDVRRLDECDQSQRRDAEKRAEAARFEPDPLGSIASMYMFATMVNERLAVSVTNIYIKMFAHSARLQLHVELTDVRARTTNALWQDMRDLSNCVDQSPDGFLRTRFKFISFVCSAQVLPVDGSSVAPSSAGIKPLELLHEHPVSVRLTLFGQRPSSVEAWETLSRVVDVRIGALRFDHPAEEYVLLYTTIQAIYRWISAPETSSPVRHQSRHHAHREFIGFGCKADNSKPHLPNAESGSRVGPTSQVSFAWQVTVRGSVEAVMAFHSERLGRQTASLAANHVVLNVIASHDDVCELQLSLDALTIKYRDAIVAKLTPERGVLLVKQLPSCEDGLLFQWRVQHLECRAEGDLALILNELYHSMNEKELSETITCGSCHQKIRLVDIDSHVCGKVMTKSRTPSTTPPRSSVTDTGHIVEDLPSSPQATTAAAAAAAEFAKVEELSGKQSVSDGIQVRTILHLEEVELYADSHLFHTVQQLVKMNGSAYTVDRSTVVKLSRVKLTTESSEFDGGAVFVPVLPLAFQMLECTIQDCGCWQIQQSVSNDKRPFRASRSRDPISPLSAACYWAIPILDAKLRYPDRCFLDVAHGSVTVYNPQGAATPSPMVSPFSITMDGVKLRSSFSDGSSICTSCHPQMGVHVEIDRVRCQFDATCLASFRQEFRRLYGDISIGSGGNSFTKGTVSTLFTCVLRLRALELTLWEASRSQMTTPLNKSLFKQIAVVMDNQLGYLSTQSTLDFRTLFSTPFFARFTHREVPQPKRKSVSKTEKIPGKHHEQLRAVACRKIQRFARQHCLSFPSHDHQPRAESHMRNTHDGAEADLSPSTENHLDAAAHNNDRFNASLKRIQRYSDRSTAEDRSKEHSLSMPVAVDHDLARAAATEPLKVNQTPTVHEQTLSSQANAVEGNSVQPASGKSFASVGTAILNTAEDLVNPMKMVAGAANVLRGGFKIVKSTHQAIETEVAQSLESAARLVNLPRIGIPIKSPFSSPVSSPTNAAEVRQPVFTSDQQRERTPSSDDALENRGGHEGTENGSVCASVDSTVEQEPDRNGFDSDQGSQSENVEHCEHENASTGSDLTVVAEVRTETSTKNIREQSASNGDGCDEVGRADGDCVATNVEDACPHRFNHEVLVHASGDNPREEEYEAVGISEALMSSLPSVVRLLVQIDDHRLCIPINPREKVGYLCREVARRFNEVHARDGGSTNDDSDALSGSSSSLLRVALHDRFGGVFSPSDVVGHLILGAAAIDSGDTLPLLFFARSIDPDTDDIRPQTRVALMSSPSSDVSVLMGAVGTPNQSHDHRRHVGAKFTRCSMLPLPLAVALLANESEGELLRCILTSRSCFARHGDTDGVSVDAEGSWPELALNAERLERLLPVEVAWFSRCLEVTHIDAFVLCLQQLGMCSSRPTSRFVGRALRERLRVDAAGSNPLVAASWRRRHAVNDAAQLEQRESRSSQRQEQASRPQSITRAKATVGVPTYESVKQLVQDRVGTYIRDGGLQRASVKAPAHEGS